MSIQTPAERKAHGLKLLQQFKEAAGVEVYDPQTGTYKPATQPLSDEFENMEEVAGAPYYDKTLNYLDAQFKKLNREIGSLGKKKVKIEESIHLAQEELQTVLSLFRDEFDARRPANPNTGELIDSPFDQE